MRRQPTTAILVIAILHLVGGGLGLLGSLCGCGGFLMADSFSSITPGTPTLQTRPGQLPPPPNPKEVMQYLNDNVPGYFTFTIASMALSFLLDIMLLSGGIGLLKMQSWARWLSLAVYAPLSILFHVASFVYTLVWVMPATQALYAKFTAAMGLSSFMTLSTGIGAFGALLVVIYPIAVLIVLLLPSTTAAFRGEIPVRDDSFHAVGEEDENYWREPPQSDKFRR